MLAAWSYFESYSLEILEARQAMRLTRTVVHVTTFVLAQSYFLSRHDVKVRKLFYT